MINLILFLFLSTVTYFPESIDSLWNSKHTNVVIGGVVAAVSLDEHSRVEFRIGDHHGHFVNCVMKPGLSIQPAVGIEILVSGTRKVYPVSERGQGVVEINPVDSIVPVE